MGYIVERIGGRPSRHSRIFEMEYLGSEILRPVLIGTRMMQHFYEDLHLDHRMYRSDIYYEHYAVEFTAVRWYVIARYIGLSRSNPLYEARKVKTRL